MGDAASKFGDSASYVMSRTQSQARKQKKNLVKSIEAGIEAGMKTWQGVTG